MSLTLDDPMHNAAEISITVEDPLPIIEPLVN